MIVAVMMRAVVAAVAEKMNKSSKKRMVDVDYLNEDMFRGRNN